MRKYRYTVLYKNGNTETFSCNSFQEAIVKGMAYAYTQTWDSRIEKVTDEKGFSVGNIEIGFDLKNN